MNQAPRKPVTAHQTRRRRRLLTWSSFGPTVATPAAGAAFEVPTAGVPTYLAAASSAEVAEGFAASGFGLSDKGSGPALWDLPAKKFVEICKRRSSPPRGPPLFLGPVA